MKAMMVALFAVLAGCGKAGKTQVIANAGINLRPRNTRRLTRRWT